MIAFWFSVFINFFTTLICVGILLSPYFILKWFVRKTFYKFGIDLYTREEKENMGLKPKAIVPEVVGKDNGDEPLPDWDEIIVEIESINFKPSEVYLPRRRRRRYDRRYPRRRYY